MSARYSFKRFAIGNIRAMCFVQLHEAKKMVKSAAESRGACVLVDFKKVAIASTVVSGGLAFQAMAATPVMAAVSKQYAMAATHIELNDKNISNPQHIVAKDPSDGKVTTWVPIYYLQQALKQVGLKTRWNGTDLTFVQYPSNWKFSTAIGNPEANPIVAPKGQMQVTLSGESAPPTANFPKMVAKDPASNVDTTYAPIYYVDSLLNTYVNLAATWNGTSESWNLTPSSNGAIKAQSFSSSSNAMQAVTRLEQKFGQMNPSGPNVDLGSGIKAEFSGGAGQYAYKWAEGRWTVQTDFWGPTSPGTEVAKRMVAYLHTHSLPLPSGKGAIMVEQSSSSSKSQLLNTTIEWQVGSKLYTLQQSGDPVQALQAVIDAHLK